MTIYEKNIDAIIKRDPQLATLLFSKNTNEKYEVYIDPNDAANINLIDKSDFSPLYESSPVEEIEKFVVDNDKFKGYPYRYFFGLGNGVLYKMLLQNEEISRIVIVEPELEIIYIILNLIDFSEAILKYRMVITYYPIMTFANIIKHFSNKDPKIYSRLYDLETPLKYYDKFHELIINTNKLFVECIRFTIVGTGNDSIDSLIGLEHHIMNLDEVLASPTLVELVNKARNSSLAVLVSTGPSLGKQLETLKKVQDYVTIISVDASFPVLEKHGIKPDIVVSMERVPLSGEFFKQTSKEAHEGVIFALSSLQHPNVIHNIKAGTKQISLRPFGYTRFTGPKEWGSIGIGMSAANMAFELIYHSSFKQCALIGQDLAYGDDGLSHADGHVLGANEVKYKESDLSVTKYGGEGTIRTTQIWDLFRSFFEADIEHSKIDMTTYNCTEGGARINGAIEMPFIDVIEMYVDMQNKKKPIVLKYLDEEELQKIRTEVYNNVEKMHDYVVEKKEEIEKVFLKVTKLCEELDKYNLETELEKVNFDEVLVILDDIDTIKQYFSEDDFSKIFMDSVQAFIVHQETEIAKILVRSVKTDSEKKIKAIDWIKAHRYWLFSLAGCAEAIRVAIERKGSHYFEDEASTKEYEAIRNEYNRQLDKIKSYN